MGTATLWELNEWTQGKYLNVDRTVGLGDGSVSERLAIQGTDFSWIHSTYQPGQLRAPVTPALWRLSQVDPRGSLACQPRELSSRFSERPFKKKLQESIIQ